MDIITDDKLFEICENLSLDELAKFARTSKRNERICGFILKRRKKEYIDTLVDKLIKLTPLNIKYLNVDLMKSDIKQIIEKAVMNREIRIEDISQIADILLPVKYNISSLYLRIGGRGIGGDVYDILEKEKSFDIIEENQ